MNNADRKRLAGYLHTANHLAMTVKRGERIANPDPLGSASDLVKQVIDELMDAPGMTDFYGNPTER